MPKMRVIPKIIESIILKRPAIRVYPPVAESIPGYKIFRFKIMKYCFKRNNACNNNHAIFNYFINRFFSDHCSLFVYGL